MMTEAQKKAMRTTQLLPVVVERDLTALTVGAEMREFDLSFYSWSQRVESEVAVEVDDAFGRVVSGRLTRVILDEERHEVSLAAKA